MNFAELVVKNWDQFHQQNSTTKDKIRMLFTNQEKFIQIHFYISSPTKLNYFPSISQFTRIQIMEILIKIQLVQWMFFGSFLASFVGFLVRHPAAIIALVYRYPLGGILSVIDLLLIAWVLGKMLKICLFSLFNLLITCKFALKELSSLNLSMGRVYRMSDYIVQLRNFFKYRQEHIRLVRFLQKSKMPTKLVFIFFLTNFLYNVYLVTFLYFNYRRLSLLMQAIVGATLVAQAIGSLGSTFPIVMVNTALCGAFRFTSRMQQNLTRSSLLLTKWQLASYSELIDGKNKYLAPRIEAFDQLTKESIFKVENRQKDKKKIISSDLFSSLQSSMHATWCTFVASLSNSRSIHGRLGD